MPIQIRLMVPMESLSFALFALRRIMVQWGHIQLFAGHLKYRRQSTQLPVDGISKVQAMMI